MNPAHSATFSVVTAVFNTAPSPTLSAGGVGVFIDSADSALCPFVAAIVIGSQRRPRLSRGHRSIVGGGGGGVFADDDDGGGFGDLLAAATTGCQAWRIVTQRQGVGHRQMLA